MSVVVVGTLEVCVRGGYGGVHTGGAKEIESVFSLWEKLAPEMKWEILVDATEDGDKVGIEGFNSFLGNVTSVIVWGNKLVGHLICLDCRLEVIRALVVQDMMLLVDAACLQSVNKGLVSKNHFPWCAVFHRRY
jgi:hypothetical protein